MQVSSFMGMYMDLKAVLQVDSGLRYTPSLALAVLAIVLFVIAFAVHLRLLVRYRTWYFSSMTIGIFMEVIGYVFRLLSSQQDPYSVPWFVVQVCHLRQPQLSQALL